jgi:hypothetical protein
MCCAKRISSDAAAACADGVVDRWDDAMREFEAKLQDE